MRWGFLAAALCAVLLATPCSGEDLFPGDRRRRINKLAFGSCNREFKPQPFWKVLDAEDPDAFVFLGDVYYLDTWVGLPWWRYPSSHEVMQAKSDLQQAQPDFAAFRNTTRVVGVWDDHDFGMNDAGIDYFDKEFTRTLFLDFLNVPESSVRRAQPGGIYTYYDSGPSDALVRTILMDVRYSYDKQSGDILGPAQWKWLEEVLSAKPTPSVILLGSGVEIINTGKHLGEGWQAHPEQRRRLMELIIMTVWATAPGNRRKKLPAVFFLSGDVHFHEFTRSYLCGRFVSGEPVEGRSVPSLDQPGYFWHLVDDNVCDRVFPFFEITSSGLTHAWGEYLGLARAEWMYQKLTYNPMGLQRSYFGRNAAVLDFNWDASPPHLQARVLDVGGETVRWAALPFASLQPMDPNFCEVDAVGKHSCDAWRETHDTQAHPSWASAAGSGNEYDINHAENSFEEEVKRLVHLEAIAPLYPFRLTAVVGASLITFIVLVAMPGALLGVVYLCYRRRVKTQQQQPPIKKNVAPAVEKMPRKARAGTPKASKSATSSEGKRKAKVQKKAEKADGSRPLFVQKKRRSRSRSVKRKEQ